MHHAHAAMAHATTVAPIDPVNAFGYTVFFACVYFLPTFIAFRRGHPSRWTIFVFNLLGGWTVIIWLACFSYAILGRYGWLPNWNRNLNTNNNVVNVYLDGKQLPQNAVVDMERKTT